MPEIIQEAGKSTLSQKNCVFGKLLVSTVYRQNVLFHKCSTLIGQMLNYKLLSRRRQVTSVICGEN